MAIYVNSLFFAIYSGCFIAASAYEDQLAIFSLSMTSSGDIIDKVEFVLVLYPIGLCIVALFSKIYAFLSFMRLIFAQFQNVFIHVFFSENPLSS